MRVLCLGCGGHMGGPGKPGEAAVYLLCPLCSTEAPKAPEAAQGPVEAPQSATDALCECGDPLDCHQGSKGECSWCSCRLWAPLA